MTVIPLSQLLAQYEKISVICHDSGGANVLNFLQENINREVLYYGFGPAKKIFDRKNRNLDSDFLKTNLILTGTSSTSNVELDSILRAKADGIATMSFIEHWTNYLERFKRGGRLVLPDRILVSDLQAKEIATKTFGSDMVTYVNNPYLEYLIEKARRFEGDVQEGTLLYVGDTYDLTLQECTNSEFDGIFVSFLKKFLAYFDITKIIIRRHPSQNNKKNFESQRIEGIETRLSTNEDLLDDILQHQFIAGYETMALYIASLFKQEVFSSKPLSLGRTILPAKNIVQF